MLFRLILNTVQLLEDVNVLLLFFTIIVVQIEILSVSVQFIPIVLLDNKISSFVSESRNSYAHYFSDLCVK